MHLCEKVSAHIHPLICDILKKPYIDKKKTFFCGMPWFVIFLINDTDERGSKNTILQSDVLFE